MKTAKVTYNAPDRDSKVVEMGGVTFYDGVATEINDEDNPHLMVKLPHNQHFTFDDGDSKPADEPAPVKRGPGRPPKPKDEPADDIPTMQPVQ